MIENLPAPLAPIEELNLVIILGWYVVFYAVAIIASVLGSYLYQRFTRITWEKDVDFSMFDVIRAGPIEEMSFRGFAVAVAGTVGIGTLYPLLVANAIWAAFHQRKFGTFIFTFVFGLYLTRFWYHGFEGLWWVAIVMHSIHNVFVTLLGQYITERGDPKKQG